MRSMAIGLSVLAAVAGASPVLADPPAAPADAFHRRVDAVNTCAANQPGLPVTLLVKPMLHAVTNITVANKENVSQRVGIAQAVCDPGPTLAPGPGCHDDIATGDQSIEVIIPPRTTLVVPYPTALVYRLTEGQCVMAQVKTRTTGLGVTVMATGFR